jgi:hypothetical protein
MRSLYPLIALGLALLLAVLSFSVGCNRPGEAQPEALEPSGPAWFEDVTDQVGLDFVHDAGEGDSYFFPRIVGSGGALFDMDGDGRLDVYLLHNGGPESKATNRLFHQRKDGRFEDVSAGSGLDVAGWGQGVAIGDVNNDGKPDVLVTEYRKTRLFLNEGHGHFREVPRQLFADTPLWATSACFFDYDRDGWLDLVIVNYVDYDASWGCNDPAGKPDFCGPTVFPGSVTKLYRNLGNDSAGHWRGFEDVTLKSGLGSLRGPGLGVACADFDGDGWPDIFVANDGAPNRLWMNQHHGTFREEGVSRGVALNLLAQAPGNMGIALGDIDGDEMFDLYVTHLNDESNTLWKQGPKRGFFQDRTAAFGLTGTEWRGTGWGTVFGDFDHVGAVHLALVNGAVYRHKGEAHVAPEAPFWTRYAERNQLLVNDGTGHFRDVSRQEKALCGTPGVYRALLCGDVDNDGALDLLVTQIAGRARLYRNVAPKHGHWLLVSALDPSRGGRDAYGAEITVAAGGRRWRRWLNSGTSCLGSNDPRAHFGLGNVSGIEAIHVRWPDGMEEEFTGQGLDRWVRLNRGEGSRPRPR